MIAIFSISAGIVLITFQMSNGNGSAPVQSNIILFILNVILLLLLVDHNAVTFTK